MTIFTLGVGVVLGLAPRAEAVTVSTVQLTADSGAEPVWGQSLTINVGASLPDASIPPIVQLDLVGFRTGDPGVGSASRDTVYLHVYDGFGVNTDGTVDDTAIGTLIGVSDNFHDLDATAATTDIIWTFTGVSLAKNVEYHYVMANNTTAASTGSIGNLVNSDLEVAADPYPGGVHYSSINGDSKVTHDLFFRVLSSFEPIPEPGTLFLATIGLLSLGMLARRRNRR